MRQTPAEIRAATETSCERTMAIVEQAQQMRALATPRRSSNAFVAASVPDTYAPGIAKLRAARGITVASDDDVADRLVDMELFRRSFYELATTGSLRALDPSASDVHRNPPNPYSEEALRAWREKR